jgi:hypothetical protein
LTVPGCVDNRWPELLAMDDERVPPEVREFAAQVCERTWCSACWQANYSEVHFYYAEPDSGVMSLEGVRPDGTIGIWSHGVDDIVQAIQTGKFERAKKDRIDAQKKEIEENERQALMNKLMDNRRPGAIDYAAFLDRRRRGLGQRIFVPDCSKGVRI